MFSYADVRAAVPTVTRHLPPTPMWSYPVLNAAVGATVHVKHENTQPVGAFKARGALNLLASTPGRGMVTYSTGNHAQSMAWAGHLFDTPCTIVMPEGANPAKVAAVRAWGATVVLTGARLADAEAHATELAAKTGHRLVSPGDTPELLAGVGTLYEEILTARPGLEAIVVPVGSGTGAAAAAIVAEALAPRCEVIAVQSAASPAAHDSWRSGTPCVRPNETRVEGLATGRGYDLPQQILRKHLTDFVLVSDDRIAEAQRLLATTAHTLAEGAGAAALAALLEFPDRFAGREVAVVCSGGNASPAELERLGQGAGR
ncbi:threonine ammonia-lyase [Paractinoplanes lichenicola]|uniref:Pyridoxal-phosphate dependent enzyme n=1 Tax=Paractinoplanes lichenicola TaxID=2802976 RepID=A0ABS1VIV6_9ACTN|nr:pyridoxal-phosphate dependent enzyme [Actinoplanes lichenicola]MBL7253677.1 pyridoxal-phosphate dependent enzyme [Actinoplanes lichenicola]